MWSFTYRLLTDLGAPVIRLYLLRRQAHGREDPARFGERLGIASRPRPQGRLIWCHAASVGEAASILSLIEKIIQEYPAINLLVTSGTVTSARMLAQRLPTQVIHQYMPVDRAAYVARFLNYWHPDFVMWIESELWPNMIVGLRERSIPVALLNARMSVKSFRRWFIAKSWIRQMLGIFVLCLTQTENDRIRYAALGARNISCLGNLKYAAKPLPFDETELTRLKQALGARPVWLLASSHHGEEEIALTAHQKLKEKWPELLTIIIPRHAQRGEEIADKIGNLGYSFAQRSKQEILKPQTEIYLADTMGELGLFYRLATIVCIGGSFTWNGHNPVEAAQLGCAIIFGPQMRSFSEIASEFLHNQAAIQLQSGNELSFTIDRLLRAQDEKMKYAQMAQILAEQKRHVLDRVLLALDPWLAISSRKAA